MAPSKTSKVILAEGVEVWRGDCRDVLSQIGSVSHALFDPPYEDIMHKAKGRARARPLRVDGGPKPRKLTFDSIAKLRDQIVPPIVEKCDGWMLAFCSPEGIAPWRDAIEAAGARYKRACFWFKPDAAPQMNGQGPGYAVEPFVAAWCGAGYSRWNGGGRNNHFQHRTNPPERDGQHETEKPVSLMLEIVELFTKRGDVVLDPFAGTGAVGIACARAGRRYIGIEKNYEYHAAACERIDAALRQADLFVEIEPPITKQPRMAL